MIATICAEETKATEEKETLEHVEEVRSIDNNDDAALSEDVQPGTFLSIMMMQF